MKSFIVNSKDLFDKEKNPKLSLSVKETIKNPKIKKMGECEVCGKPSEKLEELFGRLACSACVEEAGEGMDASELDMIVSRHGKQWVLDKLNQ